jgi:murein DD-endopeptidase MepM/ murein hydrolase activator NlpD
MPDGVKMNNKGIKAPENQQAETGGNQEPQEKTSIQEKTSFISRMFEFLTRLGLSELSIRIGVNVLSMGLILSVVWLMSTFYRPTIQPSISDLDQSPSPTPLIAIRTWTVFKDPIISINGITRKTSLHTSIPSRPRMETIKYVVQSGDSVFGIAEKFGLNPSTILWGNYATLKDTPHSLRPGQELNILPADGTYHQWQAGEGLNSVAQYYGVDPETIINYPGNHLDPDTIGDLSNPNIPVGAWLIIPGGKREFISWSAPIGVTRNNPAMARILGAGACGVVTGGAIGYGTFIWPADRHYLSGNDYSPETNHRGIDISGAMGSPIYATDAGVIVYAGWNDYGYGNMIIIDHGNDWQSLYAHLSVINITCSQSVGQGDIIGAFGSTGNSTGSHLHFELMNTVYGKVNPWNFLP